eukprot:15210-Heterococcus_DN1.PRE.2
MKEAVPGKIWTFDQLQLRCSSLSSRAVTHNRTIDTPCCSALSCSSVSSSTQAWSYEAPPSVSSSAETHNRHMTVFKKHKQARIIIECCDALQTHNSVLLYAVAVSAGILYVFVPIRMTIVKIDGGLFVYAPIAPTKYCNACCVVLRSYAKSANAAVAAVTTDSCEHNH